ncbi:hypothetical protein EZV73_08175 [Acidaminobacter sp. JC074]|uniref:hypothetical protein n=1 Tax=Acidaminobacter sp. JC074 TaxID=2530199 RepID=UPI001F0DD497|nr:hypothetical protein [Acidaminobacter sp. JC074]MCH4887545.1 hypothetical protein [Acidaminobacter sp. JC074]
MKNNMKVNQMLKEWFLYEKVNEKYYRIENIPKEEFEFVRSLSNKNRKVLTISTVYNVIKEKYEIWKSNCYFCNNSRHCCPIR